MVFGRARPSPDRLGDSSLAGRVAGVTSTRKPSEGLFARVVLCRCALVLDKHALWKRSSDGPLSLSFYSCVRRAIRDGKAPDFVWVWGL